MFGYQHKVSVLKVGQLYINILKVKGYITPRLSGNYHKMIVLSNDVDPPSGFQVVTGVAEPTTSLRKRGGKGFFVL